MLWYVTTFGDHMNLFRWAFFVSISLVFFPASRSAFASANLNSNFAGTVSSTFKPMIVRSENGNTYEYNVTDLGLSLALVEGGNILALGETVRCIAFGRISAECQLIGYLEQYFSVAIRSFDGGRTVRVIAPYDISVNRVPVYGRFKNGPDSQPAELMIYSGSKKFDIIQ